MVTKSKKSETKATKATAKMSKKAQEVGRKLTNEVGAPYC